MDIQSSKIELAKLILNLENPDLIKKISYLLKKESNPKSCPMTESEGIFKNVVSKQTSYYYRIQNLDIEIITLTDNRQNPEKIAKELEKLSLRR